MKVRIPKHREFLRMVMTKRLKHGMHSTRLSRIILLTARVYIPKPLSRITRKR